MLYTILALFCMASLMLILKISAYRKADNQHVILFNYITAFSVAFVLSALKGLFPVFSELENLETTSLFSGNSAANTAFFILVLGVISGFAFPVNILFMNRSIQKNGSGITSFFKQMSTLCGVLVSIAFLGDRPDLIHFIGMLLMTVSIVLMCADFKSLKIKKTKDIAVVFLSGAFMEVNNKLFSAFGDASYGYLFLTVIFFVSLVFILSRLLTKRGARASRKQGGSPEDAVDIVTDRKSTHRFITLKDIFYGVLLGASNMLNNYFKIQALSVLPASVVIPIVVAGSLIIVNLVGIIFFKEKFNKLYLIAVVIAAASVFLLNA